MWIIVEDGGIFEGNEQQWAECFFSNVTEEGIHHFCTKQGWKVEILPEQPNSGAGGGMNEAKWSMSGKLVQQSNDAIGRAEYLLRVVGQFMRQNPSAESCETFYDEAMCDGACLAEDCEIAANELREEVPKPSETTGQAEIEKGRRLAQASLDLSYAMEDIAKKNGLDGWEIVQLLHEMAYKAVTVAIKKNGEVHT